MDRRMNQSINIACSAGKNFGLNLMEFNKLCADLKKGDNSLFERIYLSHFKQCQNYLIQQYNISNSESYDVTMDTLINFRKSLILGKIKYGNLNFLFTRMAYFLMLKKRKHVKRLNKEELQYFTQLGLVDQDEELQARLNLIEKAIQKLSIEKQKFLEQHFKQKKKLVEMAKLSGESDATVRKRKQRILSEIKLIIKS